MLITPTIFAVDEASKLKAEKLAEQYQLPLIDHLNKDWQLQISENGIRLQAVLNNKLCTLFIDFLSGKIAYRRKQSGRKQEISRACGLHKQSDLRILDANGGLGRDAFVLACLSADVLMCERVPVLAILLEDAIARLHQVEPEIKMQVQCVDAKIMLNDPSQIFDVVYLDPMYPERQKSALVKQEMRILRELVGDDIDADSTLPIALAKANQRVVVKRGKLAPYMNEIKPDYSVEGESTRFDVYLCKY